MPELPEVEVVRLGMRPAVTGSVVERVDVLDSRSLRRHPGPPEDFVARLTDRALSAPSRRGKYLWVPLDGSDEALVMHLGMSGQVLVREPGVDDRHTRIRVHLSTPDRPLQLNFADQRIFGSMAIDELVPVADHDSERVPHSVIHIARDPLDPHFDDAAFLARLARKRTAIKRALLDQTLVSGIGNIYADEALWGARVHPEHPADALSRPRAKSLLAEVRTVLRRALAEGGTSFDELYVNVNGESGYFAHSLRAYGRTGEPCERCGTPITRTTFMNRGSHFCTRCQRRPRTAAV